MAASVLKGGESSRSGGPDEEALRCGHEETRVGLQWHRGWDWRDVRLEVHAMEWNGNVRGRNRTSIE
jgi:hypothetical protein